MVIFPFRSTIWTPPEASRTLVFISLLLFLHLRQVLRQEDLHSAAFQLTDADIIHERLHVEDTSSRGLQPIFGSQRVLDPPGIEPGALVLDADPQSLALDVHLEVDPLGEILAVAILDCIR